MANKKKGISKKSQVAIFVIVAIVIVAVVSVSFVLNNKKDNSGKILSDLEIKAKTDSSIALILGCMNDISSDSVEFIGLQGGYFNALNNSYYLNGIFIPYYYNEGKALMPKDSTIEEELGNYVNYGLNFCLNQTMSNDVELVSNTPKTSAKINENEVIFNIDMSISIKKGERTTVVELKNTPIAVKSKLFEMLEISKYITDSNVKDNTTFCISCIGKMAEDRNLAVNIISAQGNKTNLIVISQNISENIYPSAFEFLNKY